jgi:hypothetical protein
LLWAAITTGAEHLCEGQFSVSLLPRV